jgi:hypothetical protein
MFFESAPDIVPYVAYMAVSSPSRTDGTVGTIKIGVYVKAKIVLDKPNWKEIVDHSCANALMTQKNGMKLKIGYASIWVFCPDKAGNFCRLTDTKVSKIEGKPFLVATHGYGADQAIEFFLINMSKNGIVLEPVDVANVPR